MADGACAALGRMGRLVGLLQEPTLVFMPIAGQGNGIA
jgi:hypothetical protein